MSMQSLKVKIWCASGLNEITRTVNFNIVRQWEKIVEVVDVEQPTDLPADVDDFDEDLKWQLRVFLEGDEVREINYV